MKQLNFVSTCTCTCSHNRKWKTPKKILSKTSEGEKYDWFLNQYGWAEDPTPYLTISTKGRTIILGRKFLEEEKITRMAAEKGRIWFGREKTHANGKKNSPSRRSSPLNLHKFAPRPNFLQGFLHPENLMVRFELPIHVQSLSFAQILSFTSLSIVHLHDLHDIQFLLKRICLWIFIWTYWDQKKKENGSQSVLCFILPLDVVSLSTIMYNVLPWRHLVHCLATNIGSKPFLVLASISEICLKVMQLIDLHELRETENWNLWQIPFKHWGLVYICYTDMCRFKKVLLG